MDRIWELTQEPAFMNDGIFASTESSTFPVQNPLTPSALSMRPELGLVSVSKAQGKVSVIENYKAVKGPRR